ncbi:ATP-dependent DNA ligase [Rhizobium ruizarguesonis]|uniref:non-homologous end-joining DNA ligase n=1 Tax=Rhizobium ruizarguesonis TaxID=2081791 RepID=UPI0010311E79|nr:non-homologous end-joining DNA ligase [Rhizobium ruizarguesonis]TAT77135.1 ATP-dependent DNA ligase [Rhizobium ruizarguesonis]
MPKRPPKPPASNLLLDDQPLRGKPRGRRDPDQPSLPLDPMPDRIEPCLALLDHGSVRIITRGGHDWTDRFPTIAEAARKLGVGSAIIDGEAVVLDDQGRSDFGALQQSLGGRGGKRSSDESILMSFDLLYFDGHDLTMTELSARRHLLEGIVPAASQGAIRLSEEVEANGAALLAAACEHGLEGIIAKDKDSPYRSGRGGDWLKIKCIQSDTFAIVGYEHSMAARAGIGALLLAARQGGKLVYVGSVGTGFKESTAWALREQLDKLVTKKPPIEYGGRRKDVVWVRPRLAAEIEYRAWTHDGKLRHASYKGLRDAADVADIYEID